MLAQQDFEKKVKNGKKQEWKTRPCFCKPKKETAFVTQDKYRVFKP